MRNSPLLFCLASAFVVQAQAPQIPAASTPKSTTAHPAATRPASSAVKLPPGVPTVSGPLTTAFSLKYQDIKLGNGTVAVPFKVYKVFYTGHRAADGVIFDSPEEHRKPLIGSDGKQITGPDGKPTLGDPEPLAFAQGTGRLIPGFELGIVGMRVGGKRRIFIPWQLGYGTRSFADQPAHRGIPSKSDLIFDVELVDVTDIPPGQTRTGDATRNPAGAPPNAPSTPPPPAQPPQ